MRRDRRTQRWRGDRNTEKLIIAFRNFANTPKNHSQGNKNHRFCCPITAVRAENHPCSIKCMNNRPFQTLITTQCSYLYNSIYSLSSHQNDHQRNTLCHSTNVSTLKVNNNKILTYCHVCCTTCTSCFCFRVNKSTRDPKITKFHISFLI